MRACHTNNCPVGIATQKPHLRQRLEIEKGPKEIQARFRREVCPERSSSPNAGSPDEPRRGYRFAVAAHG